MTDDAKANAPAKPKLVQHPTPAPSEARTLSERAQDAAAERYEKLSAAQEARSDSEASDALERLHAVTGEPLDAFERVLCMPDERGNWISLWWLPADEFGFQVVRPAERRNQTHTNLYSKCEQHGEYIVAQNIGLELADLGDVLAGRDEWECPNCAEDEPSIEFESSEQSASEMVGNVILRAVTIAVMGKLEADKQEAQAAVRDE